MPIFRAECTIPDQDMLSPTHLFVQARDAAAAKDLAQFLADEPKGDRRMPRMEAVMKTSLPPPSIRIDMVSLLEVPDDATILRADEDEPKIDRKVQRLFG